MQCRASQLKILMTNRLQDGSGWRNSFLHKVFKPKTSSMKSINVITYICFTLFGAATGSAQCPAPVFASGLRAPTKVIFSQKDNLLVAEQGTGVPNTGRISIIDPQSAAVRTLLDGLPSALNLLGEQPAPSGPSGLAMRGRTLYVTIGSGNLTLPGPVPGSEIPNPNPSSSLFSSVLEVHFSAEIEKVTSCSRRGTDNYLSCCT